MNILSLTSGQLLKAARIKDKIALLEKKLSKIAGDGAMPGAASAGRKPRRRGMSAAGRRRIAAAQRLRWAKIKGKSKGPRKRKLSAAGRARIVAALKKRWAKAGRKAAPKARRTGGRNAAWRAKLAAAAKRRWAAAKAAGKKAL